MNGKSLILQEKSRENKYHEVWSKRDQKLHGGSMPFLDVSDTIH